MKSLNGLAYKSSGISEAATYDLVAAEYYDERLHPTCADFRSASNIYLKKIFETINPQGRIADVGCGRSLIAHFRNKNLVLMDESLEMLSQNSAIFERRHVNVEHEPIGDSEFDWLFAILGDPYNSLEAWKNIGRALKAGGQCIFIVPSNSWVQKFRFVEGEEKPDFARFLTSSGASVFLRSLIVDSARQESMIVEAGLSLTSVDHVLVGDLPFVRSSKISEFLSADQDLLDIYRVTKQLER